MATYDVTIPVTKTVIFPARCVICEKENPGGEINLSFLGSKTAPLLMVAGETVLDTNQASGYNTNTSNKIQGIPACRACAGGLKWYHRLLKFAYYTAWIPGIMPLLFLHTPQIVNIPFLILCVISPGVFTLMFPPAFGASFINDQANFEFKSKIVADEFRQLNKVEG